MKKLLLIFGFLIVAVATFAYDEIFNNPMPSLVVDNANVFTEQQRLSLTLKLNKYDNESSVQILVFTTNDLGGYGIADFGQRLGEAWGVGNKDFDNGIVIVYKGKTKKSNGLVTIQTGYGIEPIMPDAVCSRIINNTMIPHFQKGEVFEGINEAVDMCISLTKGHFGGKHKSRLLKATPLVKLLIMIGMLIIAIIILSKVLDDRYTTNGRGGINTGGFSGGGGFGGCGGFGGGFGGFGGGSFGGGGACGCW